MIKLVGEIQTILKEKEELEKKEKMRFILKNIDAI